jgi:hypothetical protein
MAEALLKMENQHSREQKEKDKAEEKSKDRLENQAQRDRKRRANESEKTKARLEKQAQRDRKRRANETFLKMEKQQDRKPKTSC